jgi:hypothetical protein
MARFFVAGRGIDLPAVPASPRSPSSDESAWELGLYVTVQLLSPVTGVRVHTNGRHYAGRPASASAGAWVALGDVVQTSTELASSRSLPVDDPKRMVAFTHVNEAVLPAHCVVNVGLASAKFGGAGGGFQAEYVSGPAIQFAPLAEKRWHAQAGNA